MKHYSHLILACLVMLLSACSSITKDIKVDAEVAPETVISKYKSYDWLGSLEALNDPNNDWQPTDIDISGDIKYLIDHELRSRGLFKTTGTPELAVSFFIGVDMENTELKMDEETKKQFNQKVPKAGLVVALIDVNTGKVVWFGAATGDVQNNPSSEIVRERLRYSIKEMFKLMPSK